VLSELLFTFIINLWNLTASFAHTILSINHQLKPIINPIINPPIINNGSSPVKKSDHDPVVINNLIKPIINCPL